ncbi:transglycosylase domain-containing protein [Stella sp.]|uniref:transglycosylase domain-containing protein n=1 Tax=Stella sp. TaxID=2912054 RepID=UPI0035AFBEB4
MAEQGQGEGRPRPRRRRSWLGFALRWAFILGVWATVAVLGLVAWYAYDLPDTRNLAGVERRPSVTMLAADGTVLATFGDIHGEAVQLRDLPGFVPAALLATEDRRFYQHFGVDLLGVARAIYQNLRAGRVVEGGSTITQQLAKNLFLTADRTTRRKVQEALLALWLERRFTKDEILAIYLNRVYFGAGTYGIDAAARRYFGKPATRVGLYEAAVLAGLPKAPSRLNPLRDPDLAADRAGEVLDNMVEAGFLSRNEAEAAKTNRTELARIAGPSQGNRYFADWALEQVAGYVGQATSDLVVATTFQPRLQALAEAAVGAALAAEGPKLAAGQGALVAMAPDGGVQAMVGGRDYAESQFNRASQAMRQPGSAFKPFVWLAALETGWRPESPIVDQPVRIRNWSPRNFNGRYLGEISLAQALAQSVNTVSVQLVQRIGVDRVIQTAHRMGVTSELGRDASLALGTSELTPVELAGALAPLANDGNGAIPYAIREIRDRSGRILYRRTGTGPGRVVAPEIAGEMNRMLAGTIETGTARAANIGRPAAGKTGTTQDYRDAWFAGWTPDLVAVVWVGNDDGRPMKGVTGGSLPAGIWRRFMQEAVKGTPPRPFPSYAPAPVVVAAPPPGMAGEDRRGGWFGELFSSRPAPLAPPPAARAGGAPQYFRQDDGKSGN